MKQDAASLLSGKSIKTGSVDLLLTSPPYLKVVNYGTANWIRLWWLGLDEVARNNGAGRLSLNAKLDHQHNYDSYKDFMLRVLRGARRVLSVSGVAVFVIGDVTTPKGSSLSLARQLWEDVGPATGLLLLDVIDDSVPKYTKVSRIWGETKGQATERDCVLVLARTNGKPYKDDPDMDWDEPYRDGGPDAAHERLRQQRQAS
jgi:site-specific DNA-methyltransferase (adenine-specific)